MPIGKGGSSGNQSGTSNSMTQGNSSSAGINGSVAMPIAPQGYEAAWRGLLGTGGNTAAQTAASNFFSNDTANSLLNPERSGWYGAVDRNNNLQSLATPGGFNATYGPTPQSAAPGMVSAPTAASQMGQYFNPFQQQVTDATTAAANQQLAKTNNALQAQYGGQYGNSGGAIAVGENTAATNTGLNQILAGLNTQGFNTALQGGQFDAGNQLTASAQNVANRMGNNQFNASLQNNRDQFGAQSMIGANQAQMANTATAANIGTNAANSAANIGGQGFAQNLGALQAGQPLFGQSNKGGSLNANDMAGMSDTTSSGKSSSKGGGLSIG